MLHESSDGVFHHQHWQPAAWLDGRFGDFFVAFFHLTFQGSAAVHICLWRHLRGCLVLELELEGDLGSLSGDDSNDITRNGGTINFVRRFSHPFRLRSTISEHRYPRYI